MSIGMLKRFQGLLLKWMLILSCLAFMIVAGENDKTMVPPSLYDSRSPLAFTVVHDLPLPASLHLSKHVLSQGAPLEAPSPVNPPSYGPFSSNGQSPTSSHLSIPFKMKSEMKHPIPGFKYIAPVHSTAAAGPSASTQPPLSPYASNCCKQDMVLKRATPTLAASPVKTPSYHSPTAMSSSGSSGRRSNLFIILGIVIGIIFIGIISVLIFCLCTFLPKANAPPGETEKPRIESTISTVGSLPHPSSTRFIAYEELKEATNNFETASVLGEGGFGRVFKGVLNDGTPVAIKRLTSGGQQGDKEFLVEVEMLSRLHHRNLVKLVGYFSNRDSSQNLLCYELVPNGSLEAWLHGPLGINCPLDWDTRMKIALDAARGLSYLHEDSQPCVIHRDFKASNILLENNFHAKVADFGLAKQAPEGRSNYLSTRVMGTFGYVAPEYAMTGHLLVKSDVYSYGVVLLELLTGRKPVDMSQPTGQENLVTWARPILRDKDRLEEIVDPSLGGKYPKEDFVRVCTIAAACVAPEANQRPTMGEVVQSLKMVQRVTEYHDSLLASSNTRANLRQSSSTFEFDGTSSVFSSGPYSGISAFENDNISRTVVFSEDLCEGR
ncbi:probable serine/threonine-protein kinase PBL21 isoform X3 [Vigna unguiculata]|uniref:probable serine/threonine-protein kinase PBL21 isoform X3 n=1 Tax=Vigna unguiculata TaxID=3917 RepID=UPI00101630B4|nr:probable serine/threonine-protein kinase PBL21 isoform X3 [Vigna unguiculata]